MERFKAYRTWAVEAGDLRAQAEALLNLGNTQRQLGDPVGGTARTAEAEALVRRMGDGALLARVLDGHGRRELGDLPGSAEAHQMASRYNLAPMVQQLDQMIAAVYASQN